MPIYDYRCKSCGHDFDVTKRIADVDQLESCPSCSKECDGSCRLITKAKEFFGEKPEEPFYSIPLGKWVKGTKDMRRQAKAKGLIEIGNEDVNKLHDRSDREKESRSAKSWNEFINPTYQVRG
jgi:putative FmdB family regulatory protein